jgi:hypothetical protein
MTVDFELYDHVRQLRRVGLRPPEQLARRIIQAGEAAARPLLELATDADAFEQPPPASFGPLHALRLLGELQSTSIIEPLLDMFPLDNGAGEDDGSDPLAAWDAELPQIIGKLGRAAVEQLWRYADGDTHSSPQRAAAFNALAFATAVDPSLRDEVVAGLRERIAASDDKLLASYALMALCNIGVPEAYGEVMGWFRAGRIDTEIMPPGAARQLLLSKGDARLACVKHPLWERYEQHGPFERSVAR